MHLYVVAGTIIEKYFETFSLQNKYDVYKYEYRSPNLHKQKEHKSWILQVQVQHVVPVLRVPVYTRNLLRFFR